MKAEGGRTIFHFSFSIFIFHFPFFIFHDLSFDNKHLSFAAGGENLSLQDLPGIHQRRNYKLK
jgi:hypothetical protein